MLQKVVYHYCFSSSSPATYPCSFYSSFTFVVVVQLLSHVQLFETPWTAACQASLSFTISRSPPKPMSIELVMPSNHLLLCHPLLLSLIFPSIWVFSNESALLIRWPKYWSFILIIQKWNLVFTSNHSPFLPNPSQPWQPLLYFLFLWTCLSWTFIHGITQDVVFCGWLLSLGLLPLL